MTSYVQPLNDDYPFSSVVFVASVFSNGAVAYGSGVMVGPNDVLTASHVVYSGSLGLARQVFVAPGLDGASAPFGVHDVEYINYVPVDTNGDGYLTKWESQYDVAILGMDERLGNSTGIMNIDPYGWSGTYHVTGYPMVYADRTGARMVDDTGTASLDWRYSLFNFSSSLDVHFGSSGGPLWHYVGATPSVAGIVSTLSWGADLYGTYGTLRSWIAGNDFLLRSRGAAPAADISGEADAADGGDTQAAAASDVWTASLGFLAGDGAGVGLVGVPEVMPTGFVFG